MGKTFNPTYILVKREAFTMTGRATFINPRTGKVSHLRPGSKRYARAVREGWMRAGEAEIKQVRESYREYMQEKARLDSWYEARNEAREQLIKKEQEELGGQAEQYILGKISKKEMEKALRGFYLDIGVDPSKEKARGEAYLGSLELYKFDYNIRYLQEVVAQHKIRKLDYNIKYLQGLSETYKPPEKTPSIDLAGPPKKLSKKEQKELEQEGYQLESGETYYRGAGGTIFSFMDVPEGVYSGPPKELKGYTGPGIPGPSKQTRPVNLDPYVNQYYEALNYPSKKLGAAYEKALSESTEHVMEGKGPSALISYLKALSYKSGQSFYEAFTFPVNPSAWIGLGRGVFQFTTSPEARQRTYENIMRDPGGFIVSIPSAYLGGLAFSRTVGYGLGKYKRYRQEQVWKEYGEESQLFGETEIAAQYPEPVQTQRTETFGMEKAEMGYVEPKQLGSTMNLETYKMQKGKWPTSWEKAYTSTGAGTETILVPKGIARPVWKPRIGTFFDLKHRPGVNLADVYGIAGIKPPSAWTGLIGLPSLVKPQVHLKKFENKINKVRKTALQERQTITSKQLLEQRMKSLQLQTPILTTFQKPATIQTPVQTSLPAIAQTPVQIPRITTTTIQTHRQPPPYQPPRIPTIYKPPKKPPKKKLPYRKLPKVVKLPKIAELGLGGETRKYAIKDPLKVLKDVL